MLPWKMTSRGALVHDQLLDGGRDLEQLVHADPIDITRAGAEVAPRPVGELALGLPAPLLVERQLVGAGLERLPARVADPPHEALRHHADHGRRHQETLDAHVEEPVQRGGGVGSVQRRQHEMAGERRLHRDAGGLDVAHLSDQDHVRVLTEDRLQAAGERDVGLLVDLDLVDPRKHVLHRVFDGGDVPFESAIWFSAA